MSEESRIIACFFNHRDIGVVQQSGHHEYLTLISLNCACWGFLEPHSCVLLKSETSITLDRELHAVCLCCCPSACVEQNRTNSVKRLR